MCVAMLGAVASLAGSAIAAGAAAEEGERQKQIAYENAERQRQAGRYEAKQIRQKVAYVNAKATAQAASRGLAISGSVLDVMTSSAVQGEIDAANTVKTANQQAHVSELEGDAAQAKGYNTATATIISGVGSFATSATKSYMGLN